MAAHRFNLFFGIFTVTVKGNNNVLAELFKVFNMLVQVPEASLNALNIGFFNTFIVDPTVHFQCLKCNNEHGNTGL